MKVTKLKRGYRLRLSDTEYEGLVALVCLGQADVAAMGDFDFNSTFEARERRGIRMLDGHWIVDDQREPTA